MTKRELELRVAHLEGIIEELRTELAEAKTKQYTYWPYRLSSGTLSTTTWTYPTGSSVVNVGATPYLSCNDVESDAG